jgi:hypothetical protein
VLVTGLVGGRRRIKGQDRGRGWRGRSEGDELRNPLGRIVGGGGLRAGGSGGGLDNIGRLGRRAVGAVLAAATYGDVDPNELRSVAEQVDERAR